MECTSTRARPDDALAELSSNFRPSGSTATIRDGWLQVLGHSVPKATVEAGTWLLAERGQISSRVLCTGATHQLEICANGGQDS